MSSTSPRRTSSSPSELQGLQLDKFLDTLDWATQSHPPTGSPSSQKSCIACKSQRQQSTSEQLPISIEHLTGHARFCVASRHQISFSPSSAAHGPLCQVPAVLSIQDGSLRLFLNSPPDQGNRCITVNLAKLISGPELNHSEDTLCLRFVFPFVSLLLERPKRDTNAANHEASRTRELQFAAMKEAVAELRDVPSSNDQPITGPEGVQNDDEDVSLFTLSLEKVHEREETKKMSLDNAFTNFMNRGAEMVMPLCFPYDRRTIPSSAGGNTRVDHAAFVDAYMTQEAVWMNTIKQVDAALSFAKRRSTKKREKEGEHTGESDEIFRVEALHGAVKPP